MKKMKKLTALGLAFIMLIIQSGAVFADEVTDTVSSGQAKTETVSIVSGEEGISENASLPEETVSEDVAGNADAQEDTEATENESVSEDNAKAVSSEDVTVSKADEYKLTGMSESYILSDDLRWEKEQLVLNDAVNELKELKPGHDYIEDQVIFTADDEEFAKEVAKAYDAELISCKNGVGVLKLDTEKISVPEAVEAGCCDLLSNMVPVNPNYLIYPEDPVVNDDLLNEDMINELLPSSMQEAGDSQIMAKTGKTLDWSYWYKEGFKDPYLAPWAELNESLAYQYMHDMVGSYEAWGVSKGKGVKVAVIDSGVTATNTDLSGKVINLSDWCKGGYYTYGSEKYQLYDSDGHGTHVAGIIGAIGGNNFGGVGIAPDATILNLPVFVYYEEEKVTSAPTNLIVEAINRAVTEGAQVINMSLGSYYYDSTFASACKNAHDSGVTVCATCGNDDINMIRYPAAYDGVISVASVDPTGQRSSFSNYGPTVDIAAPGSDILSTHNGSTKTNPNQTKDTIALMSGTSMACPVVAGVAALYISATGISDPDRVEEAMKKNASKSSSSGIGAGIINAEAMMPDDTEKPVIGTKTGEGLTALTSDSVLTFAAPESAKGGTIGYVFTVDGSDPKVSGGIVTNGIELEMGKSEYRVSDLLDAGMAAGKAVALKAIRISAKGSASKVYKGSITVGGSLETMATGMNISGPDKVAAGRSVTYKAECKPAYVKSGIKWEVRQAPKGVTVNNKGKVTVKKGTTGSFIVVAKADDDRGMENFINVSIVDPAKSVTASVTVKSSDVNIPKYNKNGVLESVRMYTADCVDTGFDETTLTISGSADNGVDIVYKSSNKKVATVDEDGLISAHKAGSAVISCMANDGSGRKAKVKVQVIVPACGVRMEPKNGQQLVSYGKKIIYKASAGDTYGKPTIKKLAWEISAINGISSTGYYTNVTSEAAKYVKVKNGKVSVNKKIKNLGYENYVVKVTASTTDGTNDGRYYNFYIVKPATVFECEFSKADNCVWIYTDQGRSLYDQIQFATNIKASAVTPNVLGVSVYPKSLNVYKDTNCIRYCGELSALINGTGRLTFTLNDGSGKKTKLKIRVSLQ